ncbi:hypothetical protein BHM03_00036016 [Ensete ventricosum]|nr:hypothetical protein BHM03_00036016 [Ensete ventricosum]
MGVDISAAHDNGQSPLTWRLLGCVDYHLTNSDIPNQGLCRLHRRLYLRLSVPSMEIVEDDEGIVQRRAILKYGQRCRTESMLQYNRSSTDRYKCLVQ